LINQIDHCFSTLYQFASAIEYGIGPAPSKSASEQCLQHLFDAGALRLFVGGRHRRPLLMYKCTVLSAIPSRYASAL